MLVLTVAAAGWIAYRGKSALAAAQEMQADGAQLRRQLAAYDLTGASATMARLRRDADRARHLTGDPVWVVAGEVPVVGRNVRAARLSAAAVADIADAAQPLEPVLPRLGRSLRPSTGTTGQASREIVDVQALATLADVTPHLATTVADGDARLASVDPALLHPQLADGVRTLQTALRTTRGPLNNAVPVLRGLPTMLGGDGPRTWMVLLQQDSEARGTGGLIGSFALLRTENGRVALQSAQPRGELARGPAIPSTAVPQELRDLWGRDLTEWAGLNLSPNFPWTGKLVAAGWKARTPNGTQLDYVAGVDAHVVAALLAATGPVTVHGVTVTSQNAADFLSRDVYRRWKDPAVVDQVTADLVTAVFGRFSTGQLDLRTLITAMRDPVRDRRLQLWSARADEERLLEDLPVGGAIPDDPGPFAMAVVNNGGGNKLDAYLRVSTTYRPGECRQGVRVGHIAVDLSSTAPGRGLPAYVTNRSDLRLLHLPEKHVVGSNRVLLDVYGPVGAQAALTTLDGKPLVPIVTGTDRAHSVWRLAVQLNPGQRRTVEVVVAEPVGMGKTGSRPVVLTQPMVNGATASVIGTAGTCTAAPRVPSS